jgi:nanoRNase/pAp phosphatase (c-di-AMP/oligoRNAs hydrolase)
LTRKASTERFPYVQPKSLKRVAVVCHRNADADAYLSAFALSRLLRSLARRCEVDVVTPEGMTSLTHKLSKKFRHEIVTDTGREYDLYVAVDVGDEELLKDWRGEMAASRSPKVLVDHHPYRDSGLYDHVVVDEGATSAAEMVFRLFEQLHVRIDKTTAQALLEGIMFDSSHLAIAAGSTLKAVVKLLDSGADIQEARRNLRTEPDQGEVIAKLKGAKRLRIFRVGNRLGATTLVGSFQAHVARALLNLGADFAIVGGESNEETRVSMRETQRFLDETKIQLGRDVAEVVAKAMGGHGGGHATAASFSCSEGEEEATRAALGRMGELLNGTPQEISA